MEFQDFIPTKGSKSKGIISTVQTQSFNSEKSKKKEICTNPPTLTLNNDDVNIKHIKREIIKLGMSGLDVQKKEEYKIQLAIKLG